MYLSRKDFEEKPYNMCLNCAYIGRKCDGPNFLAMDIARLCEWCRLRKEYLHGLDPKWTNQYIADRAELSKVSVDRFLSGNVSDLKASTASRILKVLVNGSWGQYPCAMNEFDYAEKYTLKEKLDKLQAENEHLRNSVIVMKEEYRLDTSMIREEADKKISHLKSQIAWHEKQISEKDDMLKEQRKTIKANNRLIKILCFSLAIFLLFIIAALVIDSTDPNVGFFWLRSLFKTGGSTIGDIFS